MDSSTCFGIQFAAIPSVMCPLENYALHSDTTLSVTVKVVSTSCISMRRRRRAATRGIQTKNEFKESWEDKTGFSRFALLNMTICQRGLLST